VALIPRPPTRKSRTASILNSGVYANADSLHETRGVYF